MRCPAPLLLVLLTLVTAACGGGSGGGETAVAYAPLVEVEDASIEQSAEFLIPSIVGRQLPALVRFSTAAQQPLPVVLWSHGGGYSSTNHRSAREWSRALARAGYAVIHIAHVAPTRTQFEDLCVREGLPRAECEDGVLTGADPDDAANNPFNSSGVCRPSDAIATLDFLPTIAQQLLTDWGVELDETNIAMCGWSAGSQAVVQLAGALRELSATLDRYARPDARPRAFLAVSPQGPEFSGFFAESTETSWDGVRGPVLVLTGDGDYKAKNDLDGPNRRLAFENLPSGDKYLWYSTIDDGLGVEHGTFNLEGDGAVNPDIARIHAGLVPVAHAFLDSYLRGHAPARAWLRTQAPAAAGGGGAEWAWR